VLAVASFALSVAIPLAIAPAADSSPPVDCTPGTQFCVIQVEAPGTGGGQSSPDSKTRHNSGSARHCVVQSTGEEVPCHDPLWGWFSQVDECYYIVRDPQPPASESVWEGHYPDGAVYDLTCVGHIPGTNGGWRWLPSPPEGYGAADVTPADLAREAVDRMQLVGPEIRMTGAPGEPYVVGVPLWLWTEVSPVTWGPNNATASIPGLSVTATARATRIVWDMGDGNTVTCANPGTAYYVGAPVESPTCDYIYSRTSAGQPGDAWTITATATWEVSWSGGGTSGVLTVTRTSQTLLQVGEVQALTSA